MKDKTRKTRPAGIGQAKIEKAAGQPARQISEPDRAHQLVAGPAHDRDIRQAENDGDLAKLVWKYFADEITEALRKVQEALASEESSSTR